ncbi:protein AKNAD1 isoform X8 [Canis lupus baileyi]|uniref:protein AKNAD1 isoform X7 n=1 Tax=Canis lupus familiaris TaxID=9615 RepID=UPI000BAA0968|nr:protein AKNAD1 isoform X7 [Canis lupus familiaris]XP_025273193.1 protein AKNAD1 isoform X7 [Canis lupus dingo]XP_038525863.1 protein AKNAD1 isoform X7 [Canis lupus familiaris]|eukprot:XP_022276088.1 protein AKNAD1 isoform X7 [Canis lupus familiaris]
MDKANFSEATTSKQPEDLPYDGDFSQTKIYNDYNFTSKNDILDVLNQISLTVDDPQGKATYKGTCRNADITMTLGKMTKSVINKNYDTEKQSTTNLDILTNERDPSKSNISDILLHHLSNEEFLKGQGINCETLPEIADADSSDEAIIKNIILCHVKNSWPKEQTPELTDQLSPKRDGEHSNVPCCSLTMTEENTSDIQAAGESSHQETLNFLTKIRSPHDKPKSCQGQPPQKLQTEKAVSGNVFKHGHGQVHYQLSDFSKVAPKVKTPKNNIINKPLTTDKQASFSPKLRDKSVIVQVILESMSRSNCIEKQEQKRKSAESSQQVEMEPTIHIHQEYLTGIESEASLFKVSSTSQKDPSPSSSYIFQKITRGKQMCQKLKEQTDQLKIKVQEFSKSIAQDVPYHLQDKKLVLEKLQGHLELLEQEFLDNKEKHLTLKQVHRHESPAVGDFDPERKENMEKKGHRRTNSRKCPTAIQEEALRADSVVSSDTSPSCHSASRTGLQSNKCENYGTENHNSRRVCRKEPLKEFHYRYNSPGQNYLNPNERSAFVKLCFLNDNKNSSPSCSKPEWICSQTSNPKSSHDEHETIPGKKNLRVFMTYNSDLATPSLHFYSCRISGSKSLRNFGSTKETKSEILNSSLDHALRTATILKETTDRMIRIIAEDLAKAQRWRKQMKY